jgi:hypothetical protein
MKYLKLYEAFNSKILSKTLSYIKGNDKPFLDKLKDICDKYNIELSKISDNHFKYLNFNKALDYKKDNIEVNNNGESVSKYFSDLPINLIKFWFSREGRLINVTGCDGRIIGVNDIIDLGTEFSTNMDDYTMGDKITMSDLGTLPEGTKILLSNSRGRGVAYLHKPDGSEHKYYLLQSFASGATPDDDRSWRQIANYSWAIGSTNDYNEMILLRKIDIDKDSITKLSHNFLLSNEFKLSKLPITTREVSDADFAIILDLEKLRIDNISNLSDLKKSRADKKKDAFLTNAEIKDNNINRYKSEILNKNIPRHIESTMKNIVGGENILFLFNKLTHIVTAKELYSEYLNGNLDSNSLISTINEITFNYRNNRDILIDSINKVIETFKNDTYKATIEQSNYIVYEWNDDVDVILGQIDKLKNLSKKIYTKLFENGIKSIDDIDVLNERIKDIRKFILNKASADRFFDIYIFNNNAINVINSLIIFSDKKYNNINIFNKSMIEIDEFIESL